MIAEIFSVSGYFLLVCSSSTPISATLYRRLANDQLFGYLVLSMTALFFPAYNDKLFLYLQPVFFGELAIMLYLLIKGAKVPTVAAAAA